MAQASDGSVSRKRFSAEAGVENHEAPEMEDTTTSPIKVVTKEAKGDDACSTVLVLKSS